METRPGTASQEVLTDEESISRFYEDAGLHELFDKHSSGQIDDYEVEARLFDYTDHVADIAYRDGDIDVDLVRAGMDKISDSFDDIIHEHLRPKGLAVATHLISTGQFFPKKQRGNRLDDRFWEKQFMQEFNERSYIGAGDETDEQERFKNYLAYCAKGYLWAPFTYFSHS